MHPRWAFLLAMIGDSVAQATVRRRARARERDANVSQKADSMIQLQATPMMRSTLSKVGIALLVSLVAGCGSSDDAGANPGAASSSSGGSSGGTKADGGRTADGGSTEAGGITPNGGIVLVKDAVNLGMAGNFAILSKSGISTVPTSAVTGNMGVSPAAASYITGFSLSADATNAFSTSPQVTGNIFASDYAQPTPTNLTTAIGDMQIAFTDAAGRAPKATELGAGDIGGMTLTPGVYKWSSGLLIPTDVTLAGSATDVWIFQIAQNLTVSSATKINLTGGAVSKNIFWQVSGAIELGTTAHIEGVLLSQTSIALRTGASIKGRLFAQTAVTIDGSAVVEPAL
jgi:hypothetical protein